MRGLYSWKLRVGILRVLCSVVGPRLRWYDPINYLRSNFNLLFFLVLSFLSLYAAPAEKIKVDPSPISPKITITPTNAESINFHVSIHSLRELNEAGLERAVVDVSNLTFSLVQSPASNSTFNQMWMFGAILSNRATVDITVSTLTMLCFLPLPFFIIF